MQLQAVMAEKSVSQHHQHHHQQPFSVAGGSLQGEDGYCRATEMN